MPKSLVHPGYEFSSQKAVVSISARCPKIWSNDPGHTKIIIEYIDDSSGSPIYIIKQCHIVPHGESRESSGHMFGKRTYDVIIDDLLKFYHDEYYKRLDPDPDGEEKVFKLGLKAFFQGRIGRALDVEVDDPVYQEKLREMSLECERSFSYHKGLDDVAESFSEEAMRRGPLYYGELKEADRDKKELLKLLEDTDSNRRLIDDLYRKRGLEQLFNDTESGYKEQIEQFKALWREENQGYNEPIFRMSRFDPYTFHVEGENCSSWANKYVLPQLKSSLPGSSMKIPYLGAHPGTAMSDRPKWMYYGSGVAIGALAAVSVFAFRDQISKKLGEVISHIKRPES